MNLAILQARFTSTRLPGKVLADVCGAPMLARQIERLQRSRSIHKLVVATSQEASDDAIQQLCDRIRVECFRGSLDDVLDRFYQCARRYQPDAVFRLTGDCPLADAAVIDAAFAMFQAGGYDYVTNAIEATYPDGLDVEVMRFSALEEAWKNARLKSQREHVTLYINSQPQRFKIGHLKRGEDISHLRWTVDEPEDLELIRRIFSNFPGHYAEFDMDDVLALLKKDPALAALNSRFTRNEGLQKSLAADNSRETGTTKNV